MAGLFWAAECGGCPPVSVLYRCPSGFYVDCVNRYWLPVGYVSRWQRKKRPAPVWLLP